MELEIKKAKLVVLKHKKTNKIYKFGSNTNILKFDPEKFDIIKIKPKKSILHN